VKTPTKKLMRRTWTQGAVAATVCVSGLSLFGSPPSWAQQEPATPPSARAEAPFDLTGYWVSVVTQDWRFRMVVPGRGEYAGIPLNLKSKELADAWDPKRAEAAGMQCVAYGAPTIMREPGRLHIAWQDENTLKVDTDTGMQTRLLRFKPTPAEEAAPPSRQGHSVAQWILHANGASASAGKEAPRYGSAKIVTTQLLAGLLRKNGVPFSAGAKLTEYWEINTESGGDQWLIITIQLDDPEYLRLPYVVSAIFEKEADGSKWDPRPCSFK
jgi:hypothetical protein